jgi:hypothetical protein
LENGWAKAFTFDVEDVVEELTMCRRSDAQLVVMENPQRSDAILGRTRNLRAKEHASGNNSGRSCLRWLKLILIIVFLVFAAIQ